jgi:23S rRNA (adenine-N6)-dimethyltransferase
VAGRRPRSAPRAQRHSQQHFLRSTRLVAAIVSESGVGRTDLVLDLGAGQGALTAELARRAGRVRAVEIDPALVAPLRRRFGGEPNVEIVGGDALRVPLPGEPFRVVANIPFNRTTAILRRLLDDPRVPLVSADLIVELEVACKRARCAPSTALGVYWGAWFEFALLRRLDRSAFAPRPGTDAGLLRVVPRAQPLVAPGDAAAYRSLVTTAFERRAPVRRTLRGTVSPLELKRLALELGFAPDAPPWELDQHQWAGLHRYVRRRPVNCRRHEPL